MRQYKPLLVWILIAGGLLWGYEGLTGMNLQQLVIGTQLANVVDIIIGLVALVVAYFKFTPVKKRK